MSAVVLFFPWLGAYVTGFTLGGAIHVLLLMAGVLLALHLRQRKAATLLTMNPGRILDLQLATPLRPAAYCLLVAKERARRARKSRTR